jgi:hypothetical protein
LTVLYCGLEYLDRLLLAENCGVDRVESFKGRSISVGIVSLIILVNPSLNILIEEINVEDRGICTECERQSIGIFVYVEIACMVVLVLVV